MKIDFRNVRVPPPSRERIYNEAVNDKYRFDRAARARRLRERRQAIEAAVEEYSNLDPDGRVHEVLVRSTFIRRATARPPRGEDSGLALDQKWKGDCLERPPATQLLHRSGSALPFFLTVLYVAQTEARPGLAWENNHGNALGPRKKNPSWARLAGLHVDDTRTRRARVVRALEALRKWQLVARTSQNTWEHFGLCREDGEEHEYVVPGEGKHIVRIPAAFFLNGWHLVLEPAELAVFVAILDVSQNTSAQVDYKGRALPTSERWARYGLSDEAYSSAHELDEFGLVTRIDTMPHRRRGRVKPKQLPDAGEATLKPDPYRFEFTTAHIDALSRSAYDVVSNALIRDPIPPRLLV
jgi:hypothetical protein